MPVSLLVRCPENARTASTSTRGHCCEICGPYRETSAVLMKDIATRRPVDVVAARVTAPGPRVLESSKRITTYCEAAPMAMRQVFPGVPNLTGRVQGWLTVVGMAVERGGAGGRQGRWVCRCRCGYYVLRTSKAVKNSNNANDRCDRCRQLEHLQLRQRKIADGIIKPDRCAIFGGVE